jgi:hypothetical protein
MSSTVTERLLASQKLRQFLYLRFEMRKLNRTDFVLALAAFAFVAVTLLGMLG